MSVEQFSKRQKLAKLADKNCDYQGPKTEFPTEVWRRHLFFSEAQNICTYN